MDTHTSGFDAAIVIGRFQPFHNGHLALIQHALSLAPRVLVVVGSAYGPRTPRNPWTHVERESMIVHALPASDQTRVTCIPLRDYYDEPRWRRALVHEVTTRLGPDARVVVVGHFKDATSEYLRGFAGWHLVSLPLQGEIHATPLREAYLSATTNNQDEIYAALTRQSQPNTVTWLRTFQSTNEYATLAEELEQLNAYKQAWAKAPHAPVFVTVDAVVSLKRRVLLIQRGKSPGAGLWALPGGFLELAETTLESCLRELREETGLVLSGAVANPRGGAVFDHPQRSLRGRTISHAFHFELTGDTAPQVVAADDARDCRWVPVDDLLAMESSLFDDHLLILDRFFDVLPRY